MRKQPRFLRLSHYDASVGGVLLCHCLQVEENDEAAAAATAAAAAAAAVKEVVPPSTAALPADAAPADVQAAAALIAPPTPAKGETGVHPVPAPKPAAPAAASEPEIVPAPRTPAASVVGGMRVAAASPKVRCGGGCTELTGICNGVCVHSLMVQHSSGSLADACAGCTTDLFACLGCPLPILQKKKRNPVHKVQKVRCPIIILRACREVLQLCSTI